MFSRLALSLGFVACLNAGALSQSGTTQVDFGTSSTTQELIRLNVQVEAAVVRGDVGFLDQVVATDFYFPHGDAWTSGGRPTTVDTKATWLGVAKTGRFISRDVTSQQVELHGDVALITGKIHVRSRSTDPNAQEYSVWFLRTYAKREGRWQLLSHRTVRETFGPE